MRISSISHLRDYYILTKPGIIRGNVLTAIAGFFLAAQGHPALGLLLSLVVGTSLVIASACVFNNYFDREIDLSMERTKNRATASGTLSTRQILSFGFIIGFVGFLVLMLGTNPVTTFLGLIGFVSYVEIYTPAKHKTPYATLIGTIPGAVPPVAGYAAVTNRLDIAGLLLFAMLVCWQMPHFFAIAIRRKDEYAKAKVPVWPIVHGIASTRRQMLLYAIGFLLCCIALTMTGYSGFFFLTVMGAFGVYWIYVCTQGWGTDNEQLWAKRVFLLSLPILPLMCILLMADHWLF